MAAINLLLACDDRCTASDLEDLVDEALVGLLAADGPNLAPAGRRQATASLAEIAWVDDQDAGNHVRLMLDTDMPACWLAVEVADARVRETVLMALREQLPVLDYEALREQSAPWRRGALSRLALTHDPRLAGDLRELLISALASPDALRREDAVMAAHLAGATAHSDVLKAALPHETDKGVQAMLKHVVQALQGGSR
ncbi:hypothetical protein ACG02S_05280 [Roseateles sp. DC23W]|uniref:HEAT repeat-containing protein n=1 Tax=Pelomonas dachongensis TaxID=3299029 RepID=A0ABW7EIN6_9BURK